MPVDLEFDDEKIESSIDEPFTRDYEKDPFPWKVLKLPEEGASLCKEISLAHCQAVNDRLIYRDRLYVPEYHALEMRLCFEHHDTPLAGHPGKANSYENLHRNYDWCDMEGFVCRCVHYCPTCKRRVPVSPSKEF